MPHIAPIARARCGNLNVRDYFFVVKTIPLIQHISAVTL